MTIRLLLAAVSLLIGCATAAADDTYSLIKKGRLKEANEALSAISTATLRDGNTLFFQSLLETDAAKSADLMEAALKSAVDARYWEEIHYRLAQYYLVAGNNKRLERLIVEYSSSWETGRFGERMDRYSVYVDQDQGHLESALRQVDRYLLRYTKRDLQQWGKIDKARVMSAFGKRIGADKLLRGLSRLRSGPGVSQALYQLTINAINQRRIDDAVFTYNLLREAYPSAVGLDALVDGLAKLSSGEERNREADRLTGTFYSVKVGVFSERSNATKQANLFKQYDQKVEIKSMTISDVKYRVVYVGRFSGYDEAAAFKKRLEATHHEVFQVVAR
ncbi:MAG: SPOR domain-containing protein [candidate division Zixibacteria bacterium]|nr:SPOR domain-containing protein [candidate division Zixibacteria bacterium]